MPQFLEFTKQKWFIAAGSCFVLFMAIMLTKQIAQRREVQREINALKTQAEEQVTKNQNLQSFIAYLKTDDYKQKAAREQLNLQKDGEFVYSFAAPLPNTQTFNQNQTPDNSDRPNPRKWWDYFFHPNL